MSKISEQKAKDISKKLESSQAYKFDKFSVVCGAIEGYDQALQDVFEWLEKNIPCGEMSHGIVLDVIQECKLYFEGEV